MWRHGHRFDRTIAAMSTPLRAPRDGSGRFVNWARTVTTRPTAWREPASEAEVAEVVAAAAAAGGRVRVVGAGHSWSAIAAPEDIALTLDGLAGITSVDRERMQVTVAAGTRLRDLNAALDQRGLALPIVGSIAQQSVAGVIGTGTHGSSLVHGNLSSLVESLRLVSGRGEPVSIGGADPRLDGARVHLGALGIVTEVTLRVVPAFRLRETIDNIPLATVAPTLLEIARSAEYVKVWWLPHTKLAQVFRYTRTEEPSSRRPTPITGRWIDDHLLHGGVFPALLAVARRRPAWIPPINRALARVYLDRRPRVAPSALALSTPMPVRHRETEAALPLERSGEAFDRVVHRIDRDGLRVTFPVELRFVRGDSAWMSPAHGADTCQIGAYCSDAPDVDAYFAAFWSELRALGARPHWGKELDHGVDEVRAAYPQADRFRALRDALDPARVFGSAFHTRVLGA